MARILYTIKKGVRTLKQFVDREKAISSHNRLKILGAKLEAFNTDTGKKKYINR